MSALLNLLVINTALFQHVQCRSFKYILGSIWNLGMCVLLDWWYNIRAALCGCLRLLMTKIRDSLFFLFWYKREIVFLTYNFLAPFVIFVVK